MPLSESRSRHALSNCQISQDIPELTCTGIVGPSKAIILIRRSVTNTAASEDAVPTVSAVSATRT